MDALFVLLLCLGACYLLIKIFSAFGLPRVLGPLVVGLVMGLPVIRTQVFDITSVDLIHSLADIGLILLLFYVGLEIDIKDIKKSSHRIVIISILSAIVPFFLGFFVTKSLGYGTLQCFIMGAGLALTGEAVAVMLLEEYNLLKTRLGKTIIEAGTLADAFEILLIAAVSVLVTSSKISDVGYLKLLFDFGIFTIILFVIKYLLIPIITKLFDNKEQTKYDLFTASMIFVLIIAVITDYLKLGYAIGALVAGALVRYTLRRKGRAGVEEEEEIDDMIKIVTFGFMSLFFFIWIGLNTDLASLIKNPLLGIILTVLALSGKWIGVILGNAIAKGSFLHGNLLAWGMNSRGAIELVAAEIARSHGLITTDIFTAIVFMTIATMIISPIVFHSFVKKHMKMLKKHH